MKQRDVIMILGLILGIAATTVSYAQDPATGNVEQRDIQKLEVTSGKSKVLDLPVAIKRASLANPEVADTVVLSPTQLYLTGKTTGVTNLTLWNESGKMMGMYDVIVAPDKAKNAAGLVVHQAERAVPTNGDHAVSHAVDDLAEEAIVGRGRRLAPRAGDVGGVAVPVRARRAGLRRADRRPRPPLPRHVRGRRAGLRASVRIRARSLWAHRRASGAAQLARPGPRLGQPRGRGLGH